MTRNERSLRRTQCGVKGSLHFTANISSTFSRFSLFVPRCTWSFGAARKLHFKANEEEAKRKKREADCAPTVPLNPQGNYEIISLT
jgi:hypothetical protein